MLSVAISPKDITTRELTNRKQMGAYTVPTKGQRTASRKISKQNVYKWEPTLYQPRVRGPHPVKYQNEMYTNESLHYTH
jgi:hypothetical protein